MAFMEAIKDLLKFNIKKQNKTTYRFQEVCAELSKLSGLPFGVIAKVWVKHGNATIERILAEIKQGEVKNPKPYILMHLKNN
jgi:hypothetical protein